MSVTSVITIYNHASLWHVEYTSLKRIFFLFHTFLALLLLLLYLQYNTLSKNWFQNNFAVIQSIFSAYKGLQKIKIDGKP